MPTNFPTSLDSLTNPLSTDTLNSPSHSGQHADANDAIEALEAKVGINGSAVTTSLEYRITNGIHSGLNVDSGVLYVNPTTNRVGVKTTSPNYELDVRGMIVSTDLVAVYPSPYQGFNTIIDANGVLTYNNGTNPFSASPRISIVNDEVGGNPGQLSVTNSTASTGVYAYDTGDISASGAISCGQLSASGAISGGQLSADLVIQTQVFS